MASTVYKEGYLGLTFSSRLSANKIFCDPIDLVIIDHLYFYIVFDIDPFNLQVIVTRCTPSLAS